MLVQWFNTEMTVVSIVHYVVCGGKNWPRVYISTTYHNHGACESFGVCELGFFLIKIVLSKKYYLRLLQKKMYS